MTHSVAETLSEQGQIDLLQLGVFDIGHMRFGIELAYLSEVCVAGDLLPIVSTRREVVGSLCLRGNMIPIVDLMALCGLEERCVAPELVAIVQYDGRLLGIGVDKTGGIASYDAQSAQTLYNAGIAFDPLVPRGILDAGKPVNIVEIPRIFEQPDMPSCPANIEAGRLKSAKRRSAYLTFEAGGATFGMEAVSIFGTVPRQTIVPGPVSGSRCLGIIDYLNRAIPTVDCADLVGLGGAMTQSNPEIVVLRLSDDLLIGLAVDVIRRITFIDEDSLRPPPDHLRGVAPMVSSYVLAEDDVQVFTLDQSRLEAHPNVQQIAELSRQPPPETEPGDEKPLPSAAKRTSRRCLVYTAGRRQTSDLTQVLSILELPKHVTPLQSTAPSVEGLFSHLGASVLLVDLTKACGATAKRDPAQARVLLVRGTSGDVGFLVDSVDGVENSDLVIAEKGDPIGPVAQLGQAEHRVALPFVDLHEVAAGLSPHS